MENPIITNLKNSLSKKDLKRFEDSYFQEWYLLELYEKAPNPKEENFKKKVLAVLNELDGI